MLLGLFYILKKTHLEETQEGNEAAEEEDGRDWEGVSNMTHPGGKQPSRLLWQQM